MSGRGITSFMAFGIPEFAAHVCGKTWQTSGNVAHYDPIPINYGTIPINYGTIYYVAN